MSWRAKQIYPISHEQVFWDQE